MGSCTVSVIELGRKTHAPDTEVSLIDAIRSWRGNVRNRGKSSLLSGCWQGRPPVMPADCE